MTALNNGTRPNKKLKLPTPENYLVGFGKPPAATRFKPGQSGNAKGRPKGKKKPAQIPQHERPKEIILEEAYRAIKVNNGNKQVTVPMAQAILRSLAVTAVKGNTRAQRLFAERLASSETSNKRAMTTGLKPPSTTSEIGKTSLSAASASTSWHWTPFHTPTISSSTFTMEQSQSMAP